MDAGAGSRRRPFCGWRHYPDAPDLLRWYATLDLNLIEVDSVTENCGVSHAKLPDMHRPGTVATPHHGVESCRAEAKPPPGGFLTLP